MAVQTAEARSAGEMAFAGGGESEAGSNMLGLERGKVSQDFPSLIPAARYSRMSATVIRVPLTPGLPLRTSDETLM